MRIRTYDELENKISAYSRIAIFGAGEYGKGFVYDILSCAADSKGIYCFFDNRTSPGTVIRDEVRVHPINELYENSSDLLLFLGVGINIQEQLLDQLEEHAVSTVVLADEIFLTDICQSIEAADETVQSRYMSLMDDEAYLKNRYRQNYGSELNLSNPQSFNEKINWLKLHDRNPLYTTLVDKYSVKEYVAGVIGSEYVIPTLDVYECWNDINFHMLPEQFVLKCTHDSGSTLIVKEKNTLDIESAQIWTEKRLCINPYYISREWPYKNVLPRIIIEPLLSDKISGEEKAINDYKFFCYQGEVKYLFVATDRHKGHSGMRFDFFDRNFRHIAAEHKSYPNAKTVPQQPDNYEEMLRLVTDLARGFAFVRIDMYSVNQRIYFGEYTFYPGGGMEGYPDLLGDSIQIW